MFLYQAFFQKWRIYHWRGEGGDYSGRTFLFSVFSLHKSPPSEKSRRKSINNQHGSASNDKRVPRGIVRPRKSFACNSVYIFLGLQHLFAIYRGLWVDTTAALLLLLSLYITTFWAAPDDRGPVGFCWEFSWFWRRRMRNGLGLFTRFASFLFCIVVQVICGRTK